MPTQLAPCPLRLPSALSPRRYDHQPVAIFDEPALVRVPRTAHVLPATPLAYNPCPCTLRHPRGLVSPGSRTGPSSILSRRPPLPCQVRVGDPQAASVALSDAVRPDAALPDADACCDAPPPFPGHSPCPRAAAARARHHTATAFCRPSHASPPPAWSMPAAPPHACVASAACCDSGAMPCLYRVLYVSRVYGLGACAEPRGT